MKQCSEMWMVTEISTLSRVVWIKRCCLRISRSDQYVINESTDHQQIKRREAKMKTYALIVALVATPTYCSKKCADSDHDHAIDTMSASTTRSFISR